MYPELFITREAAISCARSFSRYGPVRALLLCNETISPAGVIPIFPLLRPIVGIVQVPRDKNAGVWTMIFKMSRAYGYTGLSFRRIAKPALFFPSDA